MSKVRQRPGQADDARLLLVIVVAFAVRLILQFTWMPESLYNRIEVSTPVTSYRRRNTDDRARRLELNTVVKEGLYLYEHGIDPYDGGICHQAPILLALVSTLESLPLPQIATAVMFSSVDILSCMSILDIANSQQRLLSNKSKNVLPAWILATIVLFNPFSLLTSVSRSTATFTSLAIVTTISNALKGKLPLAMLLLAVATYLSVYPFLLIAPLTMILAEKTSSGLLTTGFTSITVVSLMLYALMYSSYLWLGSWQFIWSNYSIVLLMTDLTPNIGLWWYFFTEMFEDFRQFFLSVFQLHLLIYVAPLCIKLRKSPLFVCVTLCGLSAIFKPYPSIADTGLYLSLLPVFPHLFEHTRYLFLVACALIYCCIFGPAFYFLWIHAGSGNANFYYAITLVWNLAQGILLTDTVFANLKHQWELEDPAAREGKHLEVVQLSE